MRKVLLASFATSLLVTTAFAGSGCGSDDDGGTAGSSGTGADAGSDATAEAGPDVAEDVQHDTSDTGTETEGGTDAAPDAESEGGSDAGNDAGTGVDTARCLVEPSLHVEKSGADSSTCGPVSEPCATIHAALGRATAGDAVCVHTGLYEESWLAVPSGVAMISADGALTARISSGESSAVRFEGVDGASMDGFEVYGSWDQGSPGDGLIRVLDATNIVVRNTMAHDAPYDQDVVKVSGQVSGLVIDGLVAWNPAHRTDGNYQEVIDIFGSNAQQGDPPPVSNVIVRNSWLFHEGDVGDWLIYSKIYAEKIMYENNVFGPSAGAGFGNAAVGIGTSESGIPDATAAVVNHAIVRNNVFVGLRGDAAFAIMNADDTWLYNNTFYGNSGSELRSVVMLRANSHALGEARVFNNVFVNNHPAKSGGTFFWVRDALPSPWHLHNNLFFDNITTSDEAFVGEAASVYVDPGLSDPATPSTTSPHLGRIAEIRARFAIGASSAAANAGVDAIAVPGHPNWQPGDTDRRWDFEGDPRPPNDTWDLGADEAD